MKPTLEVKINEKKLTIKNPTNWYECILDERFFNAAATRLSDSEYALELKYRNENDFSVEDEAETIFEFIDESNYAQIININSCEEKDAQFKDVCLYGDFNIKIISD